ncbi:MBL fold metallo-hydrolase [Actinomadura atramentaria]|uniref:MBL fold metallo-hydrolase n=1 Tax=Actinomadura atramentaria TaxID=1990 RepID=UPI0003650B79|nr:MBL fold metallo-hydrolase [Actinomadura atramentaria]
MSDDRLKLTVLGSATPYPAPGNPCSGYLVSCGDTHVWLDAGTGTLGPLQEHVRLGDLVGVWISHLHADHSADLLTAYYGLLYADIARPAPLPLFGPPGTADRLAGFLTNGPARSPVEDAFAFTELHDGHEARIGPLTLTTAAVSHGMPAFAVRVEGGGRTLVYSGDTAPCAGLVRLASGCDLLLCEADGPQPADEEHVHHTPEEAGETAAASNATRLVVTHVARATSPAEAVERAASRFAGPVAHADPGAVFVID